MTVPSSLRVFPLRLHPGQEILSSLLHFVAVNGVKAGFVMTCCGDVTQATLRYACKPYGKKEAVPSSLRVFPLRLHPGQEILSSLLQFVKENGVKSGFVMTCCGNVTKATLRYAYKPEEGERDIQTLDKHHEIVSLVGTLSQDGSHHLHISLSDEEGHVIGGHVMGDMIVHTTAEIVIGECQDAVFTRPFDKDTGYDELSVKKRE